MINQAAFGWSLVWRVTRENLSQILYEVAMQGLQDLDGLEEVNGEQSIIKIII